MQNGWKVSLTFFLKKESHGGSDESREIRKTASQEGTYLQINHSCISGYFSNLLSLHRYFHNWN